MLTKKQVKTSLNARWHTRQMFLCWLAICICAVLGLALLILAFLLYRFDTVSHHDARTTSVGIFFFVLFFMIPWLAYYLYQLIRYRLLLRKLDTYELCEGTLKNTESNRYEIDFKTQANEQITRKLPALWSNKTLSAFRIKDYENKPLKVAYSKKTDKCLILGK